MSFFHHKNAPSPPSANKELRELRKNNMALTTEVGKLRILLEEEQRKRAAAEVDFKAMEVLEKSLSDAQKKSAKLEKRLLDLDARIWFFFDEMPPYMAEKWIERWQLLAPPPIDFDKNDDDSS